MYTGSAEGEGETIPGEDAWKGSRNQTAKTSGTGTVSAGQIFIKYAESRADHALESFGGFLETGKAIRKALHEGGRLRG